MPLQTIEKEFREILIFWIGFYGILIHKNPYFCVVTKIFSLIAKILLTVQIVSLIQLQNKHLKIIIFPFTLQEL